MTTTLRVRLEKSGPGFFRASCITFAVYMWLATVCAAQEIPTVCTCKDAKDILYGIKESDAAINEMERQIKQYEEREKGSGQPYMYTDERQMLVLRPPLQAVLNEIRAAELEPKPNWANGETTLMDCKTVITGGSPCSREAVELHEAHHSLECRIRKKARPIWSLDTAPNITMAQYAQEEVVSYSVERAHLANVFASLPDNCKPQEWYLTFFVTIMGSGSQTTSDGRKIGWKIKHIYSGGTLFKNLVTEPKLPADLQEGQKPTPEQIQQIMQSMQQQGGGRQTFYSLGEPIHVVVDDETTLYDPGPGEGASYEHEMITTKSKGDGDDIVSDDFIFEADEQTHTYNVTIPIEPSLSDSQVKRTVQKMFDRTPYGYGGKPTHEDNTTNEDKPFSESMIPDVKDLLLGGKIHHLLAQPLKVERDTITFDSGYLPPDPGYMDELPDVKKNLNVHIRYDLSRLPVKLDTSNLNGPIPSLP